MPHKIMKLNAPIVHPRFGPGDKLHIKAEQQGANMHVDILSDGSPKGSTTIWMGHRHTPGDTPLESVQYTNRKGLYELAAGLVEIADSMAKE